MTVALPPLEDLKPAYVEGNPIMNSAYRSFIDWAFREKDARHTFEVETGTPPLAGNHPLDQLIDEATGLQAAYLEKFIVWVTINHWGVEGDPRLEEPV
jgi:hypothetical protein